MTFFFDIVCSFGFYSLEKQQRRVIKIPQMLAGNTIIDIIDI